MSEIITREFTESTVWTVPEGVTLVDVFCVGGGGSGAGVFDEVRAAGSGGNGGVAIYESGVSVTPGDAISIIVGAGGIAPLSLIDDNFGESGGDSCFGDLVVAEGGYGGTDLEPEEQEDSGRGGRRGGRFGIRSVYYENLPGGDGIEYPFETTEEKYYGAGGAGGNDTSVIPFAPQQYGGNTGGGDSGFGISDTADNEGKDATFYGGGGGGAACPSSDDYINTVVGGNGYQGIVIIQYLGEPEPEPEPTTTIREFTESTEWVVPEGVTSVDVFCVGGGGGGAGDYFIARTSGGGGNGGVVTYEPNVSVIPGDTISIVIGAGGPGHPISDYRDNPGIPGEDSYFGDLVFSEGGYGGTNLEPEEQENSGLGGMRGVSYDDSLPGGDGIECPFYTTGEKYGAGGAGANDSYYQTALQQYGGDTGGGNSGFGTGADIRGKGASFYGGGGGGAAYSGSPNYGGGGSGYQGIIIIRYSGPGTDIEMNPDASTVLQSSYIKLITAGSDGLDGSAAGIHLRWMFNGVLGNLHLPKGNLAQSEYNFNKNDDFVHIYRTPYRPIEKTFTFLEIPTFKNHQQQTWIYNSLGGIKVRFLNKQRYDEVSGLPTGDYDIIQAYGDELIEIELLSNLFFKARLLPELIGGNASVQVEVLSDTKDPLQIATFTTLRKVYDDNDISSVLLNENSRIIRYKTTNVFISAIEFEFYNDIIAKANRNRTWIKLNELALSLEDAEVAYRLEPEDGLIHNNWPQYVNGQKVNIDNYMDRWNGISESGQKNIKQIVAQYIQLSDNESNPTAVEQYGDDPEQAFSLLELLKIGAFDYHVARMLGLGMLDVSAEAKLGSQYIYAVEYYTNGALSEREEAGEVHHLYLSLPTSQEDNRLPLPVKIQEIAPGIVSDDSLLYNQLDPDGYSLDGRTRFVTLLADEELEFRSGQDFFTNNDLFEAHSFSFPIYAGLQYKQGEESGWQKPELSNNSDYKSLNTKNNQCYNEPVPLIVSENKRIIYVHQHDKSTTHHYQTYGINIFSRSSSDNETHSIITDLKPEILSSLNAPSNIYAYLVRKESPRLLSTQEDQDRLSSLTSDSEIEDKTLIRLTFDYNSIQDIYRYRIDSRYDDLSDNEIKSDSSLFPDDELYAHQVELFFREKLPLQISGKIISITDSFPNRLEITTGVYTIASTGETLIPKISPLEVPNFAGGILTIGEERYVIDSILPSDTAPTITVYNKDISDEMIYGKGTVTTTNVDSQKRVGEIFTIIENMQDPASWGNHNPHPMTVDIGNDWQIKKEIIHSVEGGESGQVRFLEKSRGIWDQAIILEKDDLGDGIYEIQFDFILEKHAQHSPDSDSVDWHNGEIRLLTTSGDRRSLLVIGINNDTNLTLYAQDPMDQDPMYEPILTGSQQVNYYPGYKVYLYNNDSAHLSEDCILPDSGEDIRYSIFGLRSKNPFANPCLYSKFSIPSVMFAQELIEPLVPEELTGPAYTTRPDFFGKASYAFKTKFLHNPHSLLFYRVNDETLLNVLYSFETVSYIRSNLEALGGYNELYLAERWANFFNYDQLKLEGAYITYPDGTGFAFPKPDAESFIKGINAHIKEYNEHNDASIPDVSKITSLREIVYTDINTSVSVTIADFIKLAIQASFVPLTEFPLVYKYIDSNAPSTKKQNIRDKDGYLLPVDSPDFEVAPMAQLLTGNEILFTDFGIDATSRCIYFYNVREINSQLQMGEFGKEVGPVKTVNTNPPIAPEIKRVMPILSNEVLGVSPSIQFEVNAYPKEQHIRKISVYRAYNMLDAQSIRTMKLIREIDLEDAGIVNEPEWTFIDDFSDLEEIPYNDALYYRITADKGITYVPYLESDPISEYVSSFPSKIIATLIVESENPDAPILDYTADTDNLPTTLTNVVLQWGKTAYKGTYHLYKMNSNGNWLKIYEITTNDALISVMLSSTELADDTLLKTNDEGSIIYHHFKVVAENTSGMFSTQENILTI